MGKRKRKRKKKKTLIESGGRDPYQELRDRVDEDPKELWRNMPPEAPETVSARIEQRKGKATVVLLVTSPDSCGLAPWYEDGLDEIWALNDAHHLPFMQMDKVTGWFQLHQPWRYRRPTPRYGVAHWDWLKEEHPFPIYMQRVDEDIPQSEKFPLYEIAKEFLWSPGLGEQGEWLLGRGPGYQRKYFSCSFSYMAGLAYLKWKRGDYGDRPLRIEMYGTELAQQTEYYMQRPNTEFWIGLGIGMGVQFYVPAITRIMQGVFYAYRYPTLADFRAEVQQKKDNGDWKEDNWEPTDDLYDEDNIGQWPEPSLPTGVQTEFGGIFTEFDDLAPINSWGEMEDDPEAIVPIVMPGYGMGLDE